MTRPNILFCIADDAGMHMGAYGYDWVHTPGFDRVAREGVLFNRAFTPNAKCAPSRACCLTGRNSWQLEEGANHQTFFPKKFKSSFEALGENGYFTGFTGKGWAPGDPGTVDGKRRELTGPRYSDRTIDPPTPHIHNCDYAGNFEDFLNDRSDDQPFCFWYGGFEPHRGYEYGSGVEKGGKDPADIDEVYEIWPDNKVVRNDLLDYAFEIDHFDRHLNRMLEMLEECGELDNTLVIVTSDNGMPFPRAKGQEYFYSNHLPLAVMWRNGLKKPGREIDDFVSFIDFAPTLLDVAGLSNEDSGMEPIAGRSLMDIIGSEDEPVVNPDRDHVLIGKERHDLGRPGDVGYPIRGIFKDDYLYLRNFEPDRWPGGNPETGYMNCDGSPTKTEILKARKNPETRKYWEWSFGKRPEEELYCISDDPACLNNLAESEQHQELKEDLSNQLAQELRAQDDPRIFGNGQIFDEYPTASGNLKNYYERYFEGELSVAGWINETDVEDREEFE
ncbi:MAG: sulfatase [Planctomycetes bacterium]|nr:sulfatase [Planctomycetota bacterium]